jgi:hypothetical protein
MSYEGRREGVDAVSVDTEFLKSLSDCPWKD